MTEYLAEHWVISVILTIVLGAIGSGLWEAAFKPIMRKVGGYLFTLLTFGAKRARNYIYKNAAMGHHEVPSLHILLITFLFHNCINNLCLLNPIYHSIRTRNYKY